MSKRKSFTTSSKGLSVDDDVRDWDKISIPKREILDQLGYFILFLDIERMSGAATTTMDEAEELLEECAAGLFSLLEKNGVSIIEGEVQ